VQIVCNSELDAADVAVSRHGAGDGPQGALEPGSYPRWRRCCTRIDTVVCTQLLTSGRVEIRVVPKDRVFVHGKAGVIEAADGSKTCFLGSINETKSAFADNYEILWEDPSRRGSPGWRRSSMRCGQDAFPLPEAIIEEVRRVAERVEVRFEDTAAKDLPAAALAESPIYRVLPARLHEFRGLLQ
jgi:phosphatidylserine/phosphatidylglycerophosphate/cardiolipin synthase-like enzyme